jgi:hypothetical protein
MASQAIAMGDKDGDGTIDKAELEAMSRWLCWRLAAQPC